MANVIYNEELLSKGINCYTFLIPHDSPTIEAVRQLAQSENQWGMALQTISREWLANIRHRPIQSEVVKKIVLDTELRDWIAEQIADVNQEAECIFYVNETLHDMPSLQAHKEILQIQSERILDLQSKLAEIIEHLDERLNATT